MVGRRPKSEPDHLEPDRFPKPAHWARYIPIHSVRSLLKAVIALSAVMLISACTGAPEPTASPTPTEPASPIPTATATELPVATETPEPAPTTAPTEIPQSEEFISPYTPSAPSGSGASLDPVVLQLDLEEGAVYRIRTLTTQDISQSFEGQTFEIGQKMGFEYTYTVTSREPDGSAWVDVIYTRAIFESETLFGSDSYDSADSPSQIPEGAEGFAAVVGTGFSMKIGSDGEILKIEGLDEMLDQILSGLNLPDAETRQAFELTMRQQYSEQAMKDQLGNLLFDFPEGSLQVGDSWSSTQESNVMLPIIAETTYTLLDFDENTALIEVRSEIRTGEGEGGMDFGLFAFDFTISGTQEGTIQVDLNTGLANSVIDQILLGEMTMVIEGEEVSVPLNINQTVQVESVQLAP